MKVTPSMGDKRARLLGIATSISLKNSVSRGMLDIAIVDWASRVDKPASDGSVTPPIV